jgi:ATP-dependent Lon protease
VVKVVSKELRRLKKMSPQMPEYPMLRHYLELIADLPWNKSSNEKIDIRKAKTVTFEPL